MKVRLDINEIENKYAEEMSDSHLVPWVGKPLTRSINDEYLWGPAFESVLLKCLPPGEEANPFCHFHVTFLTHREILFSLRCP